jgi:predicted TIM-barrel fold metal-dependent hydrolase
MLLDAYPNLFADLSAGSALTALRRDPAHACRFLTRYADRLLFGRDFYGDGLITFLSSLDLPLDVRSRILHENAERLVPFPQM